MDKFKLNQWVNVTICVAIVTLLPTGITVCTHLPKSSQQEREILASTEIPVDHIDPGSIDLTPLINALLNATNTDSQHLFSVLSVTSHSSLALHKITLLVYNISDFQDIETSTFPLRYCYCVTNKTNDLTDFTALLLDVMGNSTSYLQELFKSSSFLSVSQRRSSDCIYICVLAGKTDRDLTELWDSVSPLFNQTFIEMTNKDSSTDFSSSFTTHSAISVPSQSSAASKVASSTYIPSTVPTSGHMTSFHTAIPSHITLTTINVKTPSATAIIPISPAVPMTTQLASPTGSAGIAVATTTETHVSMATETPVTRATSRSAHLATEILPKTSAATTTNPATSKAFHTEEPGCPWRSELFYRRSQRGLTEDPNETLDEDLSGNRPTISTIKLQPCVFELCKFFSQCLCRGLNRKSTQWRYCVSSHFWYEKHTVEICNRVKRVAFSKNLKQKCLTRMCRKI
ncbi:HERV-H LTR-associating protein 1 [Trichomycterus rosablanca]|uniref:HERV-H LTR-associating protein 1 n=1 Tax=Trichomycterus rosablanca TaxID=2290929 RepID=UPI002F3541FC